VKRRLAALVVVVLVLVTGLWFVVRPRPHRINEGGFDQITQGMTRQEVEEILGRPPGNYTDRREASFGGRRSAFTFPEDWLSDDGLILVTFDEEGRVVRKYFSPVDDFPERPFKNRVRRVLDRSLPSSWRAYLP
jgi:hypothetical protein